MCLEIKIPIKLLINKLTHFSEGNIWEAHIKKKFSHLYYPHYGLWTSLMGDEYSLGAMLLSKSRLRYRFFLTISKKQDSL